MRDFRSRFVWCGLWNYVYCRLYFEYKRKTDDWPWNRYQSPLLHSMQPLISSLTKWKIKTKFDWIFRHFFVSFLLDYKTNHYQQLCTVCSFKLYWLYIQMDIGQDFYWTLKVVNLHYENHSNHLGFFFSKGISRMELFVCDAFFSIFYSFIRNFYSCKWRERPLKMIVLLLVSQMKYMNGWSARKSGSKDIEKAISSIAWGNKRTIVKLLNFGKIKFSLVFCVIKIKNFLDEKVNW